jgi:hypothetical protein
VTDRCERRCWPAWTAGLLVALALETAEGAAIADEEHPPPPPADLAVTDAVTLPLGLPAARDHLRAVATGFGGYDGAREAGVLEFQAAVRLFGPVSIHGGGVYVSSADDVRPSLGAMVQLLEQERRGVDASLSVTYRPEGLTEPEGEIETALAFGRRLGSTSIVASATYGQDPEGNERDGELRAAGLARVGPVLVGADARGRLALTRPDGSAEPDYDVAAGPVLVVPIQSFALTGMVGASVVGTAADTTEAGVLGLLGASRIF